MTGRRPSRIGAFLTSPRNVNIHFIGCIILCTVSIIIPSVYADHYYNGGILKFREAYAQLNSYVAAYPTMTSAEVDAALAPIVPVVQGMLTSLSTFPQYFKVSWALWFIWIMYSYGVSFPLRCSALPSDGR